MSFVHTCTRYFLGLVFLFVYANMTLTFSLITKRWHPIVLMLAVNELHLWHFFNFIILWSRSINITPPSSDNEELITWVCSVCRQKSTTPAELERQLLEGRLFLKDRDNKLWTTCYEWQTSNFRFSRYTFLTFKQKNLHFISFIVSEIITFKVALYHQFQPFLKF